jgi:hypothetical protein
LVFNLIFIRNLTIGIVFFLMGLVDRTLFSFFFLISILSEGNIVDHISFKHKLTLCSLQCCVKDASNSMVTIQLIEGSNQMDYLLVLLDFNDCFLTQMI